VKEVGLDGLSALSWAASHANYFMVHLLLKRGASVTDVGVNGATVWEPGSLSNEPMQTKGWSFHPLSSKWRGSAMHLLAS
jgi:hypothetical protein